MMVYVIGVKDVCVCLCRMENRDHANEEEKKLKEETSEAPSAPAGNGLIQFYFSLINIDEC